MTERTSAAVLQILSKSVEQLDMEEIPCSQSDGRHDDGSDDLWCEDGLSNDIPDVSLNNASLLDREWKRRHTHFHTMGYRDGLLKGKEASAQEGFNAGFRQAVTAGYKWGLLRGITSALAVLPDNLKGNLVGTPDGRDRFQKLHKNVQKVSSSDALKMFHDSISGTQSISSHGQLKGNLDHNAITYEDRYCNSLESPYKELSLLLHEFPDIKINAELG